MKRSFRFSFILLAGILLLAGGLIGLAATPDLIQYAFLPPAEQDDPFLADQSSTGQMQTGDVDDPEDSLPEQSRAGQSGQENTLLDLYDKALESMGDLFPKLTLHGVKADASVRKGKNGQNGIFLYSVGPSWNDVYTPRIVKGRPILRLDAENRAPVIVLDEKTAFTLFQGGNAIGETVELDGETREVVGIAAHSRQVGETGEYAAWIPLAAAKSCDLMVLSAPAASANYYTMFETLAKDACGKGTTISMGREKTMAMLPLLVLFVILAIWLLTRWIGWVAGYGRRQIEKVRAESKRRYTLPLIPYASGQLLPPALLLILSVAACYGVAVLAISPVKTFPEWIPDTLGEYTSWISRFWYLAGKAAEPVTMKTPELARVQLWSGMIRWGAMLVLLRAAKTALTGFGKKKEE